MIPIRLNSILSLLISVSLVAHADTSLEAWNEATDMGIELVNEMNNEAAPLGAEYDRRESPVYKESLIVLNLPFQVVLAALNSGFKNQHSVGKSEGDLDPEARIAVEGFIASQKVNPNSANEIIRNFLPKYAYVLFGKNKIRMGEYGDIYVVLKPHVKKRTTWTPFDSFRLQAKVEAGESRLAALSDGSLNTFSRAVSEPKTSWAYTEAQIWGPLNKSDIAEVVFPKRFSPTGAGAWNEFLYPYAEQMIQEIIEMGIPISLLPDKGSISQGFSYRIKYKAHEYPSELEMITPEEEIRQGGKLSAAYQEMKKKADQKTVRNLIRPYLSNGPARCKRALSKTLHKAR